MLNRDYNNIKNNLLRAQSSGFVIDLSKALKNNQETIQKTEEIKKEKTKFNKNNYNNFLAQIFKKPKKSKKVSFSLNSLNQKLTERKNNKKWFSFKHKKIIFWSRQKGIKYYFQFLFKKKPKNHVWEAVIKEKRRILNSNFRYKQKKRQQKLEENLIWYRSLFSFALILLFLVVPLKLLSYMQLLDISKLEESIMVHSQAAVSQVGEAASSAAALDFDAASSKFSLASEEFLKAEDNLRFINSSLLSLASLSKNPKIKMAAESKHILEAGILSTSLAKNLVLVTSSLFNYQEGDNFLDVLSQISSQGELVYQDALDLKEVVDKINENNLPIEYHKQLQDIKSTLSYLTDSLKDFINLSEKTYDLLGKSQDKRYLLIFQNNSELRASGGFLGSYAILDIGSGEIKNLEVPAGGSYDTEGGMTVRVKAPEPLWLVNPSWHFWDANWWPDWPTTAQNLMWFYEKSGGSTVDGVITFTPTVVENLLDITGPIDMTAEYGVIISSDNFWETVQKIVEKDNLALTHPEVLGDFKESIEEIESDLPLYQDLENNSENKPKKIIGDLMARILEVLPQSISPDNLPRIINLLESSISSKNIMVYFTDEALQTEAVNRNLAGEVKAAPYDYLMVVNTNIAGQKTDRKMIENISHFSRVREDGKIINNLQIERAHEGVKNEALTGVRNVNWLRIYVPLGSRLISASGFSNPDASYFEAPESDWYDSEFLAKERLAITDGLSGLKIYQENGKTVFAGWVMTDPGETANIKISYELPFNFFNLKQKTGSNSFWEKLNAVINKNNDSYLNYSLLVQKQPGAKASQFSSVLSLPDGFDLVWQYPDSLNWHAGWRLEETLDKDKYFALLLSNLYDKR
jgi:hypothetical protein